MLLYFFYIFMALEKIRIRSLLTLNQQNQIYNNFLVMEALVMGYKEFVDQEGLTEKATLFMDTFMKGISYKSLKEKVGKLKK